jgi:hypothetical protein
MTKKAKATETQPIHEQGPPKMLPPEVLPDDSPIFSIGTLIASGQVRNKLTGRTSPQQFLSPESRVNYEPEEATDSLD